MLVSRHKSWLNGDCGSRGDSGLRVVLGLLIWCRSLLKGGGNGCVCVGVVEKGPVCDFGRSFPFVGLIKKCL